MTGERPSAAPSRPDAPDDQRAGLRRNHVAATAGIAAVLVGALLLILLLNRPDPAEPPAPVPDPTPSAAPAQETLQVLVTLGRTKLVSMLTAVGGDLDRLVMLDVPQDLLVVDGPTATPLLDANLSLNRRLPALATQNTLGVGIEGSWRMERKALAGFVDGVGGVSIEVAAPMTVLDDAGAEVMTLAAGPVVLSGPNASWYVMGTVVGEADPIAGQQSRFRQVFTQAVRALPDDQGTVAALLTSLGALSDPLNGSSAVAAYLLQMRAALLEGRIAEPGLILRPSTAADPVITRQQLQGGPAAVAGSFRAVEFGASTPMLREQFRQSPRVAGVDGAARVLVTNATDDPRTSVVALLELTDAGFVAVSAGPAAAAEPVSTIDGRGFGADGLSYASGVAKALRLGTAQFTGDSGSATPVPSADDGGAEALVMPPLDARPWGDVDVRLGLDYQPCPPDAPACLEELQGELAP